MTKVRHCWVCKHSWDEDEDGTVSFGSDTRFTLTAHSDTSVEKIRVCSPVCGRAAFVELLSNWERDEHTHISAKFTSDLTALSDSALSELLEIAARQLREQRCSEADK